MPATLYDKEKEILEFLVQFIQRYGYAPTLQEICDAVGLASPATVHEHIYKLEDKGFLKRIPGKARGIELLPPASRVSGEEGTVEVPILGFIAAGKPIEPHTDPNAYLTLANSMLKTKNTVYVLQVKGNSLIEDGIRDGDYVLIEHRSEANNGDLVVAILPSGFATLKRIFFERDRIRLQPANSDMTPIYTTEVKIQGRVIGLIRQYGSYFGTTSKT